MAETAVPRNGAKSALGRAIDHALQEDIAVAAIASAITGTDVADPYAAVEAKYVTAEGGTVAESDAEAVSKLHGMVAESRSQRSSGYEDRRFPGALPEHRQINDLLDAGIPMTSIAQALGYVKPSRRHLERFLDGSCHYLQWRRDKLLQYHMAQMNSTLSDTRAPLVALVDPDRVYALARSTVDEVFFGLREVEAEYSVSRGSEPSSSHPSGAGLSTLDLAFVPTPAFRSFDIGGNDESLEPERHRIYLHLLVCSVPALGASGNRQALDNRIAQWRQRVVGATEDNWAVMLVHPTLPPQIGTRRASGKKSILFKSPDEQADSAIAKLIAHGESKYPDRVFACVWGTEREAVYKIAGFVKRGYDQKDEALSETARRLAATSDEMGFSITEYWQVLEQKALNLICFNQLHAAFAVVNEAIHMGRKRLVPSMGRARSTGQPSANRASLPRVASKQAVATSERDWHAPLKGFDPVRIAAFYSTKVADDMAFFAPDIAQQTFNKLESEAALLLVPSQFGCPRGELFLTEPVISSLLYWVGFEVMLMLQTGNRRGAFEMFLSQTSLIYNVVATNGAPACDALLLVYLSSISLKRLMTLVGTLARFREVDSSASVFVWQRAAVANAGVSVAASSSMPASITLAPDLLDSTATQRVDIAEITQAASALDRSDVYMLIRDVFMALAKSCGYNVTTLALMSSNGQQIPGVQFDAAPVDPAAAARVTGALADLLSLDAVRHKFCHLTLAAADSCSRGSRLRWEALLRCEVARAYRYFDPRRGAEVLLETVTSSLLSAGQWPSLSLHARRLLFACLATDRDSRKSQSLPVDVSDAMRLASSGLTLIAMTNHEAEKKRVWTTLNAVLRDLEDESPQVFSWSTLFTSPDIAVYPYSDESVNPGADLANPDTAQMHVDQIAVVRVTFHSHHPVDPSKGSLTMSLVSKVSWADHVNPDEVCANFSFVGMSTEPDESPDPQRPDGEGHQAFGATSASHYVQLNDAHLSVTELPYSDEDRSAKRMWKVVATFAFPICHSGVYKADAIQYFEDFSSLQATFDNDGTHEHDTSIDDAAGAKRLVSATLLDVPDPSTKTVSLKCEPVLGAHFFADPRSPFMTMRVEATVIDAAQNGPEAMAWLQRQPSHADCMQSTASFRRGPNSKHLVRRSEANEAVLGRFVVSNTATGPSRRMVQDLLKRLAVKRGDSGHLGKAALRRMASRRYDETGKQCEIGTPENVSLIVAPNGASGPTITLQMVYTDPEVQHLAPQIERELMGATVSYQHQLRLGNVTATSNARESAARSGSATDGQAQASCPETPRVVNVSLHQAQATASFLDRDPSSIGGQSLPTVQIGGGSLLSNRQIELIAGGGSDVVTTWERLGNNALIADSPRLEHVARGDTHLFTCRRPIPTLEDPGSDGAASSLGPSSDVVRRAAIATKMTLTFDVPLAPECFAHPAVVKEGSDCDLLPVSGVGGPKSASPHHAHFDAHLGVDAAFSDSDATTVAITDAPQLRVVFGVSGVQGFRHAEGLCAIHISPGFEVEFIFKPIHDLVYCFARVTNVLADTSVYVQPDSVQLELGAPVAHDITRVGRRNQTACKRLLQPGERVTFHFELMEMDSVEIAAQAKQKLRLHFDYCHSSLAPSVLGPEHPAPIFNHFASQEAEFACAHARPFSVAVRVAPARPTTGAVRAAVGGSPTRGLMSASLSNTLAAASSDATARYAYVAFQPVRVYLEVHAHRRAWRADDPRFEQPVYVVLCREDSALKSGGGPAYEIVGRTQTAIRFAGPGVSVGPFEVTLIPLRAGVLHLPKVRLYQSPTRGGGLLEVPCELSFAEAAITVVAAVAR